jgi:hypothetical protein
MLLPAPFSKKWLNSTYWNSATNADIQWIKGLKKKQTGRWLTSPNFICRCWRPHKIAEAFNQAIAKGNRNRSSRSWSSRCVWNGFPLQRNFKYLWRISFYCWYVTNVIGDTVWLLVSIHNGGGVELGWGYKRRFWDGMTAQRSIKTYRMCFSGMSTTEFEFGHAEGRFLP